MTADQMMKAEIAKGPRPKRSKLAIAGAGVGAAALVVGGFFGVRALNDYRADIETMQSSAQDYYEAAERQNELAAQAADEAAESARLADEAVTSAKAEEQAAAAAQAAQQAEYASNGLTPEGKCPAGTTAGEVNDDGTEGLCSPNGPGGQPCVEYTDNVCTDWLKP